MTSSAYGVRCPTCRTLLDNLGVREVISARSDGKTLTTTINQTRVFECYKCQKYFVWRNNICPTCKQPILQDTTRPKKEPLFIDIGVFCPVCKVFFQDQMLRELEFDEMLREREAK